jgi:hypothetical protein
MMIDITHVKTHKSCSAGYDPQIYRKAKISEIGITKTNTQIAEQCNSILKKYRIQVGYMSEQRYLLCTRFFLYTYNK